MWGKWAEYQITNLSRKDMARGLDSKIMDTHIILLLSGNSTGAKKGIINLDKDESQDN